MSFPYGDDLDLFRYFMKFVAHNLASYNPNSFSIDLVSSKKRIGAFDPSKRFNSHTIAEFNTVRLSLDIWLDFSIYDLELLVHIELEKLVVTKNRDHTVTVEDNNEPVYMQQLVLALSVTNFGAFEIEPKGRSAD